MKQKFSTIVCSAAVIGLMALSSTAGFAQQKTAKQCTDEWRANKTDNQAKGITEKAYVAQCRAGGAAAQPSAPPAAETKPAAAPAPAPVAAPKPPAAPKPAPTAATAPTGANQFASEAQAKARCPSGTVVWVNLNSKIYHFSGHKDYGTTKKGAYMCEADTASAGARAAKDEKHP